MASLLDIKDVRTYDPAKQSDEVLRDDWKIATAWYGQRRLGKKLAHDWETIINVGTLIHNEMKERGMKFNPEDMTASARELYEIARRGLLQPMRGIYLVPKHGTMIKEGKKKSIVKSKRFMIAGEPHILVEDKKALGILIPSEGKEISLDTFKKNFRLHQITEEERKKWWPKDRKLYEWLISEWLPFKEPETVELPKGVQTFIKNVQYTDSRTRAEVMIERAASLPPTIVLVPDAVVLSGSRVYGKSDRMPNDSDIVLKGVKRIDDRWYYPVGGIMKMKLERALNRFMGLDDFQWTDELGGAAFDFLKLYDLALVRKKTPSIEPVSENEQEFAESCYDPPAKRDGLARTATFTDISERLLAQGRRSKKLDRIEPFQFYIQVKPVHGRDPDEIYSLNSLAAALNRQAPWPENIRKGVYVETKFDGIRPQVHKVGDKIKIFTEDGTDITDNIPEIRDDLLKEKNDFVAEGELELWLEGEHQNRADTNAAIKKKDKNLTPDLRLTVYDVLWWNGKDVHKESFSERIDYVGRLKTGERIQIPKRRLARGMDNVLKAVEQASKKPGSEGAMLKLPEYVYELDGQTLRMMKFKNELRLAAEVIKRVPVKGNPDTFVFYAGVRDEDGPTYVGRTFAKKLDAKKGDVIDVVFVEINEYEDPDTGQKWFNWWSPRVEGMSKKKRADTARRASELVAVSGGQTGKKKLPKLADEVSDEFVDQNIFLEYPKPERPMRFVVHCHARGRSVHLDFRIQLTKDKLIGWTLALEKGLSRDPKNFTEAKQLINREIVPLVKEHLEDPLKKLLSLKKAPEPAPWISYSGRVAPGQVGATAYEEGDFVIIDRGECTYGAQKPTFHEYFLGGKLFKGRVTFRLIENRAEWKKTGEGTLSWMMFAPREQRPYTISTRASKKRWIPPQDVSAVPPSIKKRIPSTYQYWKPKDKSQRIKLRDQLLGLIKKKEVVIDQKARFILQRQSCKGPKVVREAPTTVEEHLLIVYNDTKMDLVAEGKMSFLHPPGSCYYNRDRIEVNTRLEAEEGDVKPKTVLNPSKATPCHLEIIDRGEATVFEDNAGFKKFQFKGKELKGILTFAQDSPDSTIYNFKRSKGGPG
jgi:hypothetical protein